MSSPEHQRSRTSLHACVCARLFGDWSVIWAAWCCALCAAIHRRRLQMNASIHKYSLSISCSPRRLVVVFSSPLQKKKKKKQLKQDKNELECKWFTWEKKKKSKRKQCGSVSVCGVVILQQGSTLSLFEHEWDLLWETFTTTRCELYIYDFAACVLEVLILSFLKWSISFLAEQVEETMKWEHFVTSALQEACLGLKFMLQVKCRIRSVSRLLSFSFYTYTQYRASQHVSKKRE